ncbi:monovalent cation/H+ antiporter complex subunit F [Thermohalobacter berrensis]|nr:monovalent cation/H+ antiporter complex subunit F [Thermohalobacter berrensis]
MVLIVVAMVITSIRMIIGPTVWDRLLALNLISAKTILLLTLYGSYTDNIHVLDVSIAYGIIGFLTITLLSLFISRGGRQK